MTVIHSSKEVAAWPYSESVLAFSILVYAFHSWLDLRQKKALEKQTAPKVLEGHLNQEEFRQTQSYQLDKWWLGATSKLFEMGLSSAMLLCWYLPWAWQLSRDLVQHLGFNPENEVLVTVTFSLLDGAKDLVLSLPWTIYGTFVVEQRHGFNKQTPLLFLKDQIKTIFLGLLLMPPFVSVTTIILSHAKPIMAVYLWLFILTVQLFFMIIYPVAIAPLFNKFVPLAPGTLREKIEALAGSLGFPLKKLYVIDGSTRSAHSNAYMYGFGNNKRIVLYDTLVEQATEPQVVAVLAHELGHWKMRHIMYNLVLMQVTILSQLGLFVMIRTAPGLFESFGFTRYRPNYINFVLFQLIISPVDEVLTFATNLLSRKFEYQADAFAVKQGHAEDLKGGLRVLDRKNKAPANVDWLYSAAHHSHPVLAERLHAIDTLSRKQK